uniref:DDB1- and CUL4-associated factor 10 n=1 Tax=Fundulus heteroclitus TaxID=8078 RepID=A0A3Q2PCY3_FUNHE
MSSDHQGDGEDADESQDRPDGAGKEEEEPAAEELDGDDDVARKVCASPGSRSEGQPERGAAASPRPEEPERRSPPAAAPPEGSGASDGSRGSGLFSWLRGRTIRRGLFVDPARDNFRTMTSLYCSMSPAAESVSLSSQTHGAVFNLEYSPDGSVLTVACEQTEVLLFDPISSRHIKTLTEAHEDCVNNIRFLDNRLFATCSDDTTIALWDLRKLNSKVCSLHGHASWVKNIEYDTNTRLLVTSGFDGNVITWDTNRFTEDGCPHKKFFHTRYLMRMRLTPDCSKMLISTSSGYLLILHDLDLTQSLEVGSYRMLRARRTPLTSEGGTSASRSTVTPRQGHDSKIHPHREGQGGSQEDTDSHSQVSLPTVIKVSFLLRSLPEEQPGGLNPRDPRREGPRELHHIPAASPQRLGHAHPLLQQHGRPGVDVRVRVPGGRAHAAAGVSPLLPAPHPLHRGGQRGAGLHQGAVLQPRRTAHLLALRLRRPPARLRRALQRAGRLPARADELPAGDPFHLLAQRRGAHHQVLPDALPAGLGLPQRTRGAVSAQVLASGVVRKPRPADLGREAPLSTRAKKARG